MTKTRSDFLYALLLAAVAAAAAYFLLGHLNDLLVADEPQFVDVAASLATTARPLAYSGSTWHPVLSHPQLYHALLAVPVALAGKVPAAGRVFGVLAFFAAGVLLWLTVRRVTGERWGPFLAVFLYGLHPLALQSALLVEIDTALLPLLAVLFVWFLAGRDFELGGAGWLGAGLLFGVALMAKFTTPPLFIVALAAYYVGARRPRELARLGLAAATGIILCAVYYVPYCLLRGLPLAEPFVHSWARVAAAGGALAPTLARRGLKLVLWLGLPFLAAFVMVTAQKGWRHFRGESGAVVYAAFAAFVILVCYLFVGGDGFGFVKYHAPLVPLAALALGATVGPALARESKKTILFLGVLAFAYYVLVVRDPLYWPYLAREMKEVYRAPAGDVTRALALTAAFLVIPLIAFVIMTRRRGRTMAFVILAAAAGPALDLWQDGADYEVRYNYGERGFADAVEDIAALPPDAGVVVPVDVAFADGYRHAHVAVEDVLRDARAFAAAVRADGTAAVVLRDAYYIHRPYEDALGNKAAVAALESYYDIFRRGSFAVAIRKSVPGELKPAAE